MPLYLVLLFILLGVVLALFLYVIWQFRVRYRKMNSELSLLRESTQQSQTDLSLALEAGNLSVWVHDLATDTIRFMKKDFTMADPIQLEEHFKLKHPDDLEACKVAMEDLLTRKKENTKVIYHYIDSSVPGGYRIIESFVTAKWHNGSVVEMIGVEHDVTHERLVLSELELAKKKSLLAIESSGIISFELDIPSSTVTIVNAYGMMKERKIPIGTCLDYIYEPDKEVVRQSLYEMILKGKNEPFHLHFRMILPGREGIQYCTIHGNAFEIGQNNRPSLYIGYITNQTAYVEVNERLNRASRHNQIILDNANCGLLYADKDYNILWQNIDHVFPGVNVFCHFCKKGHLCSCRQSNQPGTCVSCLIKQCLDSQSVFCDDYVINEDLEVQIQLIPVVDNGQAVGVVCRVDDVTSRKKAIHELEIARQKAEASSQLKTTFLANMGHEIRTPLNAITGFASLLADASDEERLSYINIINENSQNLTKLIENLLELSNLECGELQLSKEPIYLPALLDSIVDKYQENSTTNGVKIQTDYAEALTINSDPNRILEVLDNFMSNAIKYTSEGSVTIGCEKIEDAGVRIFVRDTGIGIPEEKRPRVFHRFEKLGSMVPGNGLGLSICKAIMDACGGSIDYESKMGQGSTFWIIVPN